MEVYAGFLEHTDHHVGRLIDALEELGVLDDTLVYYIIGDNGASAEGTAATARSTRCSSSTARPASRPPSSWRAKIDEFGGPEAYNHYAVGWAHAMDTPYQWTKQVASHWGGTRNGTIVHWPNGIEAKGEVAQPVPPRHRRRPDGARSRRASRARRSSTASQQKPMRGRRACATPSTTPTPPSGTARSTSRCSCNRGIYHEGWTRGDPAQDAVGDGGQAMPAFDDDVWEL